MQEKIKANPEEFIEIETKEKVFARMCQVLEKNERKVSIPFDEYDSIEKNIIESNFLNEAPEFFSQDTKQRILIMRIMESYCKEEQTTMEDLIGAVINPSLCKGKTISTKEDTNSCVLIIELTESH